MKILFLSAFAVSLILLTPVARAAVSDFEGIEEELLPEVVSRRTPAPVKKSEVAPVAEGPTVEAPKFSEPSPVAETKVEGFDELFGIEEELLPDTAGEQRFTPNYLHQNKKWNADPRTTEIDTKPLKGQKYSIIPWDSQNTEDFLDAGLWIREREIKDKMPDWKIRLRQDRHAELMGKLISCRGSCLIYRGVNAAKGRHLSQLKEGDELHVGKDSAAWVFMIDGTILRVAAESSVTMQEINIGKSEIFFHVRLGQGHAFWHPRSTEKLAFDDAPETDAFSLPIMIKESNLQFFERKIFDKGSDADQLSSIFSTANSEIALRAQYDDLYKRQLANTEFLTLKTKLMMVAPNATLVSSKVSFDFVFTPGGKSYFKKRSTSEGEEFTLTLRGYNDVAPQTVLETSWQEVDAGGKSVVTMTDVHPVLLVSELLTKRIKTFELAREVWIEAYTRPLLREASDAKKLAVNHGYVLWDDHAQRIQYLSEFTRRIETTNMKSLDNLITKLDAAGEKQNRELSPILYQAALNDYLKGLKSRYTEKNLQVRYMSDVQYYVWILKNAKR